MMTRSVCVLFAGMLSTPLVLSAQTYAPVVTMRVTVPGGTTQEISARDSGVATVTLTDGTVYEFRPTIHDEPFRKVTVSIFKAATATEPVAIVGELQATKGGPAVDSKSKPPFRVAILNIEGPPAKPSS
jgi:hypothetical protein